MCVWVREDLILTTQAKTELDPDGYINHLRRLCQCLPAPLTSPVRRMLAGTATVLPAKIAIFPYAHGCVSSSKKKIRDHHELVKDVRAQATAEAGFTRIQVEPRMAPERNQRRADIFFVEPARTGTKEIWHYTDDTGGHPLCTTHFDPAAGRESISPVHTLNVQD